MNIDKLVLATGNPGKVREMAHVLAEFGIQVLPQSEFDMPEAIEDGLSFIENAIKKARHAAAYTGLPAIADDSGIEVDALDGRPGIYSARYAGEQASDSDNNQKLLHELQGIAPEGRSARYQCAIAFVRHKTDPTPQLFLGSWEGSILPEPIGEGGFGYDPLFWLADKNCSAAQLSKDAKYAVSHRGKAMQQLLQYFKQA